MGKPFPEFVSLTHHKKQVKLEHGRMQVKFITYGRHHEDAFDRGEPGPQTFSVDILFTHPLDPSEHIPAI